MLAVLPEEERQLVLSHAVPVNLEFGQVLYQPYESISHAYFLLDAMTSLLSVTMEGFSVEVAIIGREGMLGAFALLEKDTTPYRALVQGGGGALRIEMQRLRELAKCHTRLQQLLLRYVHALLTQAAQSAVCNRFHSVQQRLTRWLAFAQDRWGLNQLPWTQDFLAHMLGADRASVAVALGELKKAGLIRQSYGQIEILDRAGIRQQACECYPIVKAEFDDFLGNDLNY